MESGLRGGVGGERGVRGLQSKVKFSNITGESFFFVRSSGLGIVESAVSLVGSGDGCGGGL
jgi:hypothetical protein